MEDLGGDFWSKFEEIFKLLMRYNLYYLALPLSFLCDNILKYTYFCINQMPDEEIRFATPLRAIRATPYCPLTHVGQGPGTVRGL